MTTIRQNQVPKGFSNAQQMYDHYHEHYYTQEVDTSGRYKAVCLPFWNSGVSKSSKMRISSWGLWIYGGKLGNWGRYISKKKFPNNIERPVMIYSAMSGGRCAKWLQKCCDEINAVCELKPETSFDEILDILPRYIPQHTVKDKKSKVAISNFDDGLEEDDNFEKEEEYMPF